MANLYHTFITHLVIVVKGTLAATSIKCSTIKVFGGVTFLLICTTFIELSNYKSPKEIKLLYQSF